MAVPKKASTPAIPNKPSSTGTDRLRRILTMKSGTAEAAGRSVDVLSPEVARSLANGDAADRVELARIWGQMSPAQKKVLVEKIATEFPNPRSPIGLSIDADRVLGVASGRDLTPDELAAVKAEGIPDSPHSRTAPEDPQQPSNLSRLPLPEGFDPKAARVKDVTGGSSKLETRPHLREPDKAAELIELPGGKRRVVLNSEEGTGRVGPQDIGSFKAGGRYEAALKANVEMQRQSLLGIFGDQEGINAAIKQMEDGDESVAAIFKSVRDQADKAHPIPAKPYPVSPDMKNQGAARASLNNPQADFNEAVFKAVEGRTNTPIYQAKPGRADVWSNLLDNISMDFPKGEGMPIQARFPSPEVAARMILRNADPAMFDVTPITPSQASGAKDLLGQLGITSQHSANQVLGVFEPDLPYGQQPRQVKIQQAEEAIARQLRERFGDKWGADYQPAPASDLTPAPESRVPEPGPGTSQDLADIPAEMGRTNTRGEKPQPVTNENYEEAITSYNKERQRVRDYIFEPGDPTGKRYMDKEYVEFPDRPKKPGPGASPEPQAGLDLDDPDLAEVTQQGLDADEMANQRRIGDLQRLEENLAAGRVNASDPPRDKGSSRTWSELSPQEQHQSGYGSKPSDRAWEDDYTEYNNLNRRITPGDQAKRVATAEGLAGTIDNFDTTPAAEIRREIKQVEEYMQTHGMTPEVAARGEAKLAELKAKLQKAINLDQMSGVVSDRKGGPLSGRVNKVQGRGTDVDAANRALDEAADPDKPAISPKPPRPNAVNTPEAFKAKVDKFMEKSGGRSRGSKKFVAEGEALIKEAETLGDEASKSLAQAVRGAIEGKTRNVPPKNAPKPEAAAKAEELTDTSAPPPDKLDGVADTDVGELPTETKPKDQPKPAEAPKAEEPKTEEPKPEPGARQEEAKPVKGQRTLGQKIGRAAMLGTAGGAAAVGIGLGLSGIKEPVDQPWGEKPPEDSGMTEEDAAISESLRQFLASQQNGNQGRLQLPASSEDRIRAVQARPAPIKVNLNTQIPGSWNY